jgi:hypothetical protein
MEESSDALDSAVYAAELYNQIKQEQVMGLNSIMGQGMIGNAQNSLMGNSGVSNGSISNAQQAAWNAAAMSSATKPFQIFKENKPRLSMELSIIQADNGFIVNIGEEQYTGRTPHVAMTIEDVCTIITSQLASRMLDRTE